MLQCFLNRWSLEDDYGMIDGVINNGSRGENAEKAKPSIRERLENARRECLERKNQKKVPLTVTRRSMASYGPEQEMAAGMVLLFGREQQEAV